MAYLKRWSGSAWVLANLKRWTGSAWAYAILKRWTGSAWDRVYHTEETHYFDPSAYDIWWEAGSAESTSGEHIQGTYDGTTGNRRHSLILFSASALSAALGDAMITGVSLRLKRLDTSHGAAGTGYADIRYADYGSIPGSLTGASARANGEADSGDPGFARGEEKWVTLSTAVGDAMRDGSADAILLATASTALAYYTRYDATRTQLAITCVR